MWFIILQDLPVHLDQADRTVCYIYLIMETSVYIEGVFFFV
jgi:hypothetical protein